MFKKVAAFVLATLLSTGSLWAHGANEHIMGTVTAVNSGHLTIQTTDGKTEMVMLDKTTKYFVNKKVAAAADMKVGSRVVVDAKMDPKMKMYSALEVNIGVAAPAKPNANAKPGTASEKKADHK